MYMQMYQKAGRGQVEGSHIRATLPYIRTDVPIVIVFRALGFVADRDILEARILNTSQQKLPRESALARWSLQDGPWNRNGSRSDSVVAIHELLLECDSVSRKECSLGTTASSESPSSAQPPRGARVYDRKGLVAMQS